MHIAAINTGLLPGPLLGALLLAACTATDPEAGNKPPAFISEPVTTADHNRTYRYTLRIFDADNDSLSLSGQFPAWLSLDADALVLSGLAGWEQLGEHSVELQLSDGRAEAQQAFTITVGVGEIDCSSDFGDPDSSLYILPYLVGATHKLLQGYCPNRTTGGHVNWYAYDLDTATGDTIIAIRAGKVLAVQGKYFDGNRTPGQENLIFIQHADGTVAFYVHFTHNGPLVQVGQRVAQGQPIGLSGDTGGSTSPHVHMVLFRQWGPNSRQYSMPLNFRNAQGILDARRGLITGRSYTALPFTPDSR